MDEKIKELQSLAPQGSSVGALGFILLAAFLVTVLSLMDSTPRKNVNPNRTAFQTKRDMYDIRMDDKSASNGTSLETGL